MNCHNVVNRFGDRCKLCLALKSGASVSEGLLPEDSHHRSKGSEASKKHHYRSNEPSSKTIRVDSSHSSSRHRH